MPKSKYPALSPVPGCDLLDRQLILNCNHSAVYLTSHVDHDGSEVAMVRVMKTSPESMTVQIRTYGSVTGSGTRGKPRAVYSQFSSNRKNMLLLADEIRRIAEQLPEA